MFYNFNNSLLRQYLNIRINKNGYGKKVYIDKYENEKDKKKLIGRCYK